MNLIEPFRQAIEDDWQSALTSDEWFFARRREDLAGRLSPNEAFDAIGEATKLLQQQTEPLLRYECGAFLLSLARRSDTTEMPSQLRSDWDAVIQALHNDPSVAEQLRDWYRLSK